MKPRKSKSTGKPAASEKLMPVLFIGHGNPMNAIEDNEFSAEWRRVAQTLPRPKAILCISAHWETWGPLLMASERPPTIHDFGGFPSELYGVRYPAPGNPELARRIENLLQNSGANLDDERGFDHGCWSFLRCMFPKADVPVVQLSLDYTLAPQQHYDLAKNLAPLRREGILVAGSGNVVHNLGLVAIMGDRMSDFNKPFGFDWAFEADSLIRKLIDQNRHTELMDYWALGKSVQLAVPTPEHYLPMIYSIALKEENESVEYFNVTPVAGSLTMTSFLIR
jgi:4,5-DOPA dioxygenase extradiol